MGQRTKQADSLSAEPLKKPRNTGVGSLSLLQGNFLSQESNWGLLHHRWILYYLSYPGSPLSLQEDMNRSKAVLNFSEEV